MNIAIILAAGQGSRLKLGYNKMLVKIEKPLFLHTLAVFEKHQQVEQIIVVANKNKLELIGGLIKESGFKKVSQVVSGGQTRQESSRMGVEALPVGASIVLLHDGARPFVTEDKISELILAAQEHGAAVMGVEAKDTIKVAVNGFVEKTMPREQLVIIQTPQAFQVEIIKRAQQQALSDNFLGNDDAVLVERLGGQVKVVEGNEENFKITTPQDLQLAKQIIQSNSAALFLRRGLGQDSHRFSEVAKPLVLGGVKIVDSPGLAANSDGDVVLHALCNALASSVGKGSLGTYADKLSEQGITDSGKYLQVAMTYVKEAGYSLSNISVSIEAKSPRLEKHLGAMRQKMAELTNISVHDVGITVTSGDGLTSFGRGEGIQVFVVVSLKYAES